MHLNFTSVLDRYPDPVFRMKQKVLGDRAPADCVRTWSEGSKCLSIYEQKAEGNLKMLKQKSWHHPRSFTQESPLRKNTVLGYDERLMVSQ